MVKQFRYLSLLSLCLLQLVQILRQEHEEVKELSLLFAERRVLYNRPHAVAIRYCLGVLFRRYLVLLVELFHHLFKPLDVVRL